MEENDALIYLSEDADFTGKIEASHIIVQGNIKGTVRAAKSIRLKPGSHVEGEIVTEHFFPEDGATYNGKLHILAAKKRTGADTKSFNKSESSFRAGLYKLAGALSSWALW